MSLENFLQEINKKKLKNIQERKNLATSMRLALPSFDAIQSEFPDAEYIDFPYGENMHAYLDKTQNSPLFIHCPSCDLYLSELLEKDEEAKDEALQKKAELLAKENKMLVKTTYSCPVCTKNVGNLITARKKEKR